MDFNPVDKPIGSSKEQRGIIIFKHYFNNK